MHVLITGASSGIGEALARQFAADPDCCLTLVARRQERLDALASALPCKAIGVRADLSDPDAVYALLDAATAQHGPVDVLVNNAGAQVIGHTDATDLQAAERSLAVNLTSPLRLIHAVLPSMRSRGSGSIINVSSMAAIAPTPGMTWYNASKAGIASASEALASELRNTGIHVLTVYPGVVRTDMMDKGITHYKMTAMLRNQPVLDASDVARDIVTAYKKRRRRLVRPRMFGPMRWMQPLLLVMMDRMAPQLQADPPTGGD